MNTLKRKLKKLKNDPKKFFVDMRTNHEEKLPFVKNDKYVGSYQYTVVSAVYNVEKYLEDYFKSFVSQELDFKKHINLILVDDGSTDGSAKIIKKWQKKFPKNIEYIYKENGGQASARNLGLKNVNTKWVTFVDPDDFLDEKYFLEVDRFLGRNKNKNVKLVGCQLVFYIENQNLYRDNHPLKYRFNSGDQIVPYDDLGKNMQLSASTAFFISKDIKENNIFFDERVKPNFEDAQFIAFYLGSLKLGSVGFSSAAKYFYRKREDGSSTLDTSWQRKEQYANALQYGCLLSLKNYKKKYGYVPEYFQRTVLYNLTWYVKYLVNKKERISFLTQREVDVFESLVSEIFSYIDHDVIVNFELAGCWFYFKIGMLNCFKNEKTNFQIAYVEDYDQIKNQVLISYFTGEVSLESFEIDGFDQIPEYAKTIENDFVGQVFAYERRCWVTLPEGSKKLTLNIDGIASRLSFSGKQHKNGINIDDIKNHFIAKNEKLTVSEKYKDCWILMDRDTQADDNAEHLYRYIQKYHPEKNAYFVLRSKSHDWQRLSEDGFNLLAFGSNEHELALKSCDKIISSHADVYVMNYFRDNSLLNRDFIFLQHGVTKDDMSSWFNSKRMAKLIVAATDEYNSIAGDNSRYKFGHKEVALTGFPRHDRLLSGNKPESKSILVMPTWRQNIVGKVTGSGNSREINPGFMDTSFAIHWRDFLHSNTLKELSEQFGYEIVFFPHANIQPYLKLFNLPKHIKLLSHTEGSIQKLFQESSMMITDYSSVAFEMAYLGKPILYYQFDKDEVYSGGHIYSKGYFDYERDGFGPVLTEEYELLVKLEYILKKNGKAEAIYADRMKKFFPFKDGKCCERTYQAITALDKSDSYNSYQKEIKFEWAETATKLKKWLLAESRWRIVESTSSGSNFAYGQLRLAEALIKQGKLYSAKYVLESVGSNFELFGKTQAMFMEYSATLHSSMNNWCQAEFFWLSYLQKDNSCTNVFAQIKLLECLVRQHKENEAKQYIAELLCSPLSLLEKTIVDVFRCFSNRDKQAAILNLSNTLDSNTFEEKELQLYKPELLLSELYREFGLYDDAHQVLVAYESHTQNDHECRKQIALLQGVRKNWTKVVSQFNQAYVEGLKSMTKDHAVLYVKAIRYSEGQDEARMLLVEAIKQTPECIEILNELGDWKFSHNYWQNAIKSSNSVNNEFYILKLSESLRHQGYYLKSENLINNLNIENNSNPDILAQLLIEKNELLMIKHQWKDAVQGWAKYVEIYSEKVTNSILIKWLSCSVRERNEEISEMISNRLASGTLSNIENSLLHALLNIFKDDYYQALEHLTIGIDRSENEFENKSLKPQLLLAEILREVELYDASHNVLASYEHHTNNDPLCRIEIALLQEKHGNWEKVFSQLDQAFPEGVASMPNKIGKLYIKAARLSARYKIAELSIERYSLYDNLSLDIRVEQAEMYTVRKNWGEAVKKWSDLFMHVDVAPYRLAYVYRVQGKIDEAISILTDININPPSSQDEWILKGDLAQLSNQWELAANCWRSLLKNYSATAPSWVWERYQEAQLLNSSIKIKAA